MMFPNRNTLWGTVIADELAKAGIDAVCLAPGSRCTALTVAFSQHDDVETYSHLDERSAAFFALGRAKRTGVPTPLVCTSGTAAANFHPAVIEANQSRVPLLLLTADRPRVLHDSGANQTIDQEALYGDAVRAYRTLPEPEADARKLRALRTAIARAVGTTTGTEPGPVHLNVPFEKPLEPTISGDIPDGFVAEHPTAVYGRDGQFVTVQGQVPPSTDDDALIHSIETADRGLIIAGAESDLSPDVLCRLTDATGFPVLADPLSGLRFGSHVERALICGGYDSYLPFNATPDLVLRFGASPTSKTLRRYLKDSDSRQFVIDPASGWRESTFTATDLVTADPTRLAAEIAERIETGSETETEWQARFATAENRYWSLIESDTTFFEGRVLHVAASLAPDPCTLFVSNSMPVRDLDRFGKPRAAEITALGNRGASGIDGITSTALGAGSATDEPLVLVTGDLAYYHDMNGLLAIARCGVDATIVLVNNNGGGIFHALPIEDFDPPFTDLFTTPHGLDFEPTSDLYGFDFTRVDSIEDFHDSYLESLANEGTRVIEVVVDGEASHRHRETLHEQVNKEIG